MKRHIALFDMDGTLTPARKPISEEMISALCALGGYCDIGIVTGSGMNYIDNQLSSLLDILRAQLFPCNGTQIWWKSWREGGFKKQYEAKMIDEIGEEKFKKIVKLLLSEHSRLIGRYPEMPLAGNFIDNRGSMINFCPAGRGCDNDQRKKFVEIDAEKRIRKDSFDVLKMLFSKYNIGVDIALGGNTSIDIFPYGWDKTYVLSHLGDYETISFVGDRCDDGGNDKALYNALKLNDFAFKTTGPEETIKIINEKLIPIFGG